MGSNLKIDIRYSATIMFRNPTMVHLPKPALSFREQDCCSHWQRSIFGKKLKMKTLFFLLLMLLLVLILLLMMLLLLLLFIMLLLLLLIMLLLLLLLIMLLLLLLLMMLLLLLLIMLLYLMLLYLMLLFLMLFYLMLLYLIVDADAVDINDVVAAFGNAVAAVVVAGLKERHLFVCLWNRNRVNAQSPEFNCLWKW